jgi:hypothetical protein
MKPKKVLLSAIAVASALATFACAPEHASDATVSTMIVGLQTEEMGSLIGRVHVVATVGGVVKTDEVLTLTPPTNPAALPKELTFVAPNGDANAKIDVKVEAFAYEASPGSPSNAPTGPILTRLANTKFVRGETKLLRMRLEARCVGGVVGGLGGPVCTAPQTCVSGRCIDSTLLPQDLEPYRTNWATDLPDICRPVNHGPPEVVVGTGQTDYAPITEGQTLQAELGPQKGHHLWIALRMRNMKQSGSTTTITAVQPGTNAQVPPTAFVFTFDKDEGGYCKLYGLRYQLDNGGIDYKQFLGKPLDVTVEVRDTTGATQAAVAHINVDPAVIGEP